MAKGERNTLDFFSFPFFFKNHSKAAHGAGVGYFKGDMGRGMKSEGMSGTGAVARSREVKRTCF